MPKLCLAAFLVALTFDVFLFDLESRPVVLSSVGVRRTGNTGTMLGIQGLEIGLVYGLTPGIEEMHVKRD